MKVTVRFYAALREAVGDARVEIDVPDGAVVSDVFDRVAHEYPSSRVFRNVMRGAIDDAYVRDDVSVAAGSVVHIITPVSGG
ncbi:MAG: MoaD/ThiS family protein [Rhodothermales bacterium]|nr:MoaD/ThiS family protein [Rhodothermales bacterium]